MVRIRRLQAQDEKGRWYNDSYAIETPDGQVEFRYNLTWEHMGGRYANQIRDSGLQLNKIDQVLSEPKLKWLPVETLDLSYAAATEVLDRECHIPSLQRTRARPV